MTWTHIANSYRPHAQYKGHLCLSAHKGDPDHEPVGLGQGGSGPWASWPGGGGSGPWASWSRGGGLWTMNHLAWGEGIQIMSQLTRKRRSLDHEPADPWRGWIQTMNHLTLAGGCGPWANWPRGRGSRPWVIWLGGKGRGSRPWAIWRGEGRGQDCEPPGGKKKKGGPLGNPIPI